jgi:hypothetical protein
MDLLRKLFGSSDKPSVSLSVAIIPGSQPRSAELLKDATRLKDDKRFDEAVVVLRQALEEIAKEGGGHTIATFLRLPMMLQLAGKRDEAWAEYNRLLISDLTGTMNDPEVGPMERSQVYDKMRLLLQREGKHKWAVSMGIFSYIQWAIGLKRQRRTEELREVLDPSAISAMLEPLLKKAKATDAHDELVKLLKSELSHMGRIDFASLARKIDPIIPGAERPSA